MQCLLLLDRPGDGLGEGWAGEGVALLPVVGRAVCEYAIEEVVRAGCEAVYVAAGEAEAGVAQVLGEGARWGVSIHYVAGRPGEHPAALARRCDGLRQPFLVVRGDVLYSGVSEFVRRAVLGDAALVLAQAAGVDVGLGLCRDLDSLATSNWIHCDPAQRSADSAAPPQRVEVDGARFSGLDSAAVFHGACLDVAAGSFTDYSLNGWERAPGLRVGPGSFVDAPSIRGARGYIGRNCRVHEGAELSGRVVIGANSFVDRGARVENSVILPGTYVGENVELRNTLVAANRLLRVDTGSEITVTDPFLLAAMNGPAGEALWRRTRDGAARLLRVVMSRRTRGPG